ncbi:hypothetical protein [Sphingomonas sp. MM-1]|uniref:hypothetical protein n=1 Tax=Sphingomonas sp. MM-1 TaxID=745310 RepID=UPI00118443F1|nr:hypothetical protein [Sphingomonas sp. MM-1]
MLGNFALALNDLELIDDGMGAFYVYSAVSEKSVSQFSVRDLNEMIKNASNKSKHPHGFLIALSDAGSVRE